MKKSLILSVVCLLAAVLTTTTASAQIANYAKVFVSAEADGAWVKNYKDFPKSTPILKIRMKNVVDSSKTNSQLSFSESPDKPSSYKANLKKYTFGKIKCTDMPIDADGWYVYTFDNPLYLTASPQDDVSYNNIQFFIDDTYYKEMAIKKYLFLNTNPETLLDAVAFCEDGDVSHIGNQGNVKYSSRPMPKLAAEYKKKAADKQAEIERRKQETEQKRLAEEKRRQEEAAKAAEFEQQKEAFKKKYGVTNDEKGEYVMKIYESAVLDGTEASYAALGRVIAIGYGIKNKNYKDAIEYINIALNITGRDDGCGVDFARFFMADMYWNGWGVAQDRHKAIEYYTKAVSDIIIAHKMSNDFNPYDVRLYVECFHKVLLRVGNYYDSGQTRNGAKEIDTAIYWYAVGVDWNKSHADENYGEIAYRLGRYYETARVGAVWGIPDIKTARYLYHQAYNNGDAQTKAKAKQALDRIGH